MKAEGVVARLIGGKLRPLSRPLDAIDDSLMTVFRHNELVPLVIDFGKLIYVDAFRFATGMDHSERDPVRWELFCSNDDGAQNDADREWMRCEASQEQERYETPRTRGTFTDWFPIVADKA